MFLSKNTGEAYWNSYRLLEKQLIRLSHSICFDDDQIEVYSPELADIINSACIKIESLAKDIYEQHIYPFQIDTDTVPKSIALDKKELRKWNQGKWERKDWKYDFHCLVEIDEKYAISKKRVRLKSERFQFLKYGSSILPFNSIAFNKCLGGKWEYSNRDVWVCDDSRLIEVKWCKSYQDIKHNYIQSIRKHGTVKNAIMVLAAYYLLAIYNTCLPFKRFDWDYKSEKFEKDFGSELFTCEMCYHLCPPFIIDSDYTKAMSEMRASEEQSPRKEIFAQQNLLNDIDGFPFFIVLKEEAYQKVKKQVEAYCAATGNEVFDIAPYERNEEPAPVDAGAILYSYLKRYIKAPYYSNNMCLAFNTGVNTIYNDPFESFFDYEKSKYKNKREQTLRVLKEGDLVEVKFIFDDEPLFGKIKNLTDGGIDLGVQIDGKERVFLHPISNIIYIKKQ